MEKYCKAGQATDDNGVMQFACWISMATNTSSEYVNTYFFSTATMVKPKLLSVVLYIHCLSCLKLYSSLPSARMAVNFLSYSIIRTDVDFPDSSLCKYASGGH